MSGAFSKPKSPKIPKQEQVEEIQTVTEDATIDAEKEKKRLLATSGKLSTLQAGIANAILKKRLGE